MMRVPDPQPRPIDRNPSIECRGCGESYRYQEYWMPRYVDGVDCHPRQLTWFCDECMDRFNEWRQQQEHERQHITLGEWSG